MQCRILTDWSNIITRDVRNGNASTEIIVRKMQMSPEDISKHRKEKERKQ